MDWIHETISDTLQLAVTLREYSSNTTLFDKILENLELLCTETMSLK